MVSQIQPTYRYRLDPADMILGVDRWWLAFASENNAIELNESAVVGHQLWDFISGEPTRTLYKEIHQHVRSTGNSVSIPFRCDSPTLQRYLQLTISDDGHSDDGHSDDGHSDEAHGHLLYESKLLRTAPQRRVNILDPKQKRSRNFLTMCSFCKRSLIEPSGWLEIENISLKLRMYEKQTVPELRYTVCPECSRQFKNERQPVHQSAD